MRDDSNAGIPFSTKIYPSPLERKTDGPATTLEEPLLSFSSRDEGPFLASSGKESQRYRHPSRGGGLNLNLERNFRGRATIPEDPEFPFHSRYTCFPCTDSAVTASIDSQHDGNCDSPLEPREKATDPCVNSTGSLTLQLQLERKADFHVST